MNRIFNGVAIILFALLTGQPVLAEPKGETPPTIDELRKAYVEAGEALAAIERPALGSKGFSQNLSLWSEAFTLKREAAQRLVVPLVGKASQMPAGAEEFPNVRDELLEIHQAMTGKPSQASHDNLTFFANTIHPQVLDRGLNTDCAALFVRLTKPDQLIRMNDRQASQGQPTEPTGWSVQDTYALSLLRAGKLKEARKESDLLLMKLDIILAISKARGRVGPGVNYRGGVRSIASLHREYLLHRALLEALVGDVEATKSTLAESNAIKTDDDINDTIKNARALILKEIDFQLGQP